MSDDAYEIDDQMEERLAELKGTKISGLVALAKLKKMHQEKPWLYEEEEHAVLKLAEDAVEFIKGMATTPLEHYDTNNDCFLAKEWLEEHK